MSRIPALAIALLWLVTPAAATALERPQSISVLGMVVGATTFGEMQRMLGPFTPIVTGEGHESALSVCVVVGGGVRTLRVEFHSYLEGTETTVAALDRIVDLARVELTTEQDDATPCELRAISADDVLVSNGLRLGMSRADVERLLGTDWKYRHYWRDIDSMTYGTCWEVPIDQSESDYDLLSSRRDECFFGKAPYFSYCQHVEVRLQDDKVIFIEVGEADSVC